MRIRYLKFLRLHAIFAFDKDLLTQTAQAIPQLKTKRSGQEESVFLSEYARTAPFLIYQKICGWDEQRLSKYLENNIVAVGELADFSKMSRFLDYQIIG